LTGVLDVELRPIAVVASLNPTVLTLVKVEVAEFEVELVFDEVSDEDVVNGVVMVILDELTLVDAKLEELEVVRIADEVDVDDVEETLDDELLVVALDVVMPTPAELEPDDKEVVKVDEDEEDVVVVLLALFPKRRNAPTPAAAMMITTTTIATI
jgi:hypothetical protein